jgi:hypothetical protein
MPGLLAELANWPKFSPPAQSFRLAAGEAAASFVAFEGCRADGGLSADGLGRGVLEAIAAGLLAGWALHSRAPENKLQRSTGMPMVCIVRRDVIVAPRAKQRSNVSRK